MKRAAALAGVALAACSATPPAAPAKAETGPEASAAIAAATVCVQKMNGGVADGFVVAVEQATAHRDPGDGSRWIVAFPPGHYMGRLPPPGPGKTLLLAIEPAQGDRCTALSPTPLDR